MRPLSLRARLGILYAVLLVCSVVMRGFSSYLNIWQLFVSSRSSHLRAVAKPVIEHWLADTGLAGNVPPHLRLSRADAAVLARDLTSRDAAALVLDSRGRVLAEGRGLPEEPEAPPPEQQYVKRALSGENEVTYRATANGRPMLVLLIPLRPRPGDPKIFGVVQMSTPLTEINRMLFSHGAMLIAVAAIILITGTIAGFWLIGMSLRDLRGLLETCNRISRGDFSTRVSISHRDDEIGQLAHSFNRMLDRLEAAFASQRRFVANAAHELLTPLTGLRGSLEVLMRGAQDDPAAVARLSKGMYQEVRRLIRLCEQLLGMSRLENSSNINTQSLSLTEFFQDFMSDARLLADDQRIVLSPGPYARVSADTDVLRQILLNLLSNALRYSSDEAPVVMGWKLYPDHVEIRVSDRGSGMNPKTLERIFEPFFQGKYPAASGRKGTGLGLALVKSMVEAHGGTIRAESEPGHGTTIFFTIPLSKS